MLSKTLIGRLIKKGKVVRFLWVCRSGRRDRLAARMPFPVHPHMLRHACGYKLANDGQDTHALQHYLGHKNIQHTVRYTELSPARFKSFWDD
jgi:type 1 fimbriae regulatory protein FimB/type 1 fimbriae regulatory protein FimE